MKAQLFCFLSSTLLHSSLQFQQSLFSFSTCSWPKHQKKCQVPWSENKIFIRELYWMDCCSWQSLLAEHAERCFAMDSSFVNGLISYVWHSLWLSKTLAFPVDKLMELFSCNPVLFSKMLPLPHPPFVADLALMHLHLWFVFLYLEMYKMIIICVFF